MLCNTYTIVANFDDHMLIQIGKLNGSCAINISVFDGVYNEVGKYLPDVVLIGRNVNGTAVPPCMLMLILLIICLP